jgi:5'(3')-deoxyribonucleotidase
MNRIFVDLDGVVVNFERLKDALGVTGEQLKKIPGAYLQMEPIDGAIAAVHSLIGMGFEVWIATKPPTGIPHAYADKAAWVMKHLPDLKRRLVITHDKGLLGDRDDFLLDDRPHKANCASFKGTLIGFRCPEHHGWCDGVLPDWPAVLDYFRTQCKKKNLPEAVSQV